MQRKINLDVSAEYIKTLKTISDLQEVYRIVESPSKRIIITGGDECKSIEGGIINTPIGCFKSLQQRLSSLQPTLTPLAQDILDSVEVEYTVEELADINLSKCVRNMK